MVDGLGFIIMNINNINFKLDDIITLIYEVHPSNKIIKANNVKIINIQPTMMRNSNEPYHLFTTQSKTGKNQYWDSLNLIEIKKEQ